MSPENERTLIEAFFSLAKSEIREEDWIKTIDPPRVNPGDVFKLRLKGKMLKTIVEKIPSSSLLAITGKSMEPVIFYWALCHQDVLMDQTGELSRADIHAHLAADHARIWDSAGPPLVFSEKVWTRDTISGFHKSSDPWFTSRMNALFSRVEAEYLSKDTISISPFKAPTRRI